MKNKKSMVILFITILTPAFVQRIMANSDFLDIDIFLSYLLLFVIITPIYFYDKKSFKTKLNSDKKLSLNLLMTLGLAFLYSFLNLLFQNSFNLVFMTIQLLTILFYCLTEELIFRGLILEAFLEKKLSTKKSIIICSILFSLCHFISLDFSYIQINNVLPLLIKLVYMIMLGTLLAYIYINTGKLSTSIFVHAGLNSILLFVKIQSQIICIYFLAIIGLILILLHNYLLHKKETLC